MGRKKGRVRWTSVEDGFFGEDCSTMRISEAQTKNNGYFSDENTNSSVNCSSSFEHSQNRPHQDPYYSNSYRRNHSRRHRWNQGGIAPRFERKTSDSQSSYAQDFEGEEQLPNGFYKIRSKNLDVLFKKDYYAHKSHLCAAQTFQSNQTDSLELDNRSPTQEEQGTTNVAEFNEDLIKQDTPCPTSDLSSVEDTDNRCASWVANSQPAEKIEDAALNSEVSDGTINYQSKEVASDPVPMLNNDQAYQIIESAGRIPEVEMEHESQEKAISDIKDAVGPKKSKINENASPFYPSGYLPPASPIFMQHPGGNPPTLYLYNPGAQSIVPCDEIVITSPIIAPDGSTVFANPSNVYLPYESMMPYLSPQVIPNGLIQYDQYGVPYTTYHQQSQQMSSMSPSGEPMNSTLLVVDSEEGSSAYSSEGNNDNGSVESNSNTPPDLSGYSPANWNENPILVPDGFAQTQWFPQQYFYQHQISHKEEYEKSRGPNIYYQSDGPISFSVSDNNWIPSSTGESLAGEDDKTRNKFITKGTKDERRWGDSMKEESKDQTPLRLIPGLPESLMLSAKKVQKKRRKKRGLEPPLSTANSHEIKLVEEVKDSGNISTSEDDYQQSYDKEVQKRTDPQNFSIELPTIKSQALVEETTKIVQESTCEISTEGIVEVVKTSEVIQEPPAQTKNINHSKKVGGQRKKVTPYIKPEEIKPAAPVKVSEVQKINDDQWEIIPNEIKENKFEEWETSVRGKRCRKGGRQFQVQYLPISESQISFQPVETLVQQEEVFTPKQDLDQSKVQPSAKPLIEEKSQIAEEQTKLTDQPDHQARDVQNPKQPQEHQPRQTKRSQKQQSKQPVKSTEVEIDINEKPKMSKTEKKLKDQESRVEPEEKLESETSERSASVSSAQSSSVMKKTNQKKRLGKDDMKAEKAATNVRQVLVQDGTLNFSDPEVAGARRLLKRPNDLINEHAFILKDIGHGMGFGPMATGRINQGKYQPPDRSAEILYQFMRQQKEKGMQEARLQFATQPLKITKLLEITDSKQQTENLSGAIVKETRDLDLD